MPTSDEVSTSRGSSTRRSPSAASPTRLATRPTAFDARQRDRHRAPRHGRCGRDSPGGSGRRVPGRLAARERDRTRDRNGLQHDPRRDGTGPRATQLVDEIARLLSDPAAPPQIEITASLVPLQPSVTDAAAATAVENATLMARDVALADGKETWTIPGSTVRSWISFAATPDGRYVPVVAQDAAVPALTTLAKTINRDPTDASFLMGRDEYRRGRRGRQGRANPRRGRHERARRAGGPRPGRRCRSGAAPTRADGAHIGGPEADHRPGAVGPPRS